MNYILRLLLFIIWAPNSFDNVYAQESLVLDKKIDIDWRKVGELPPPKGASKSIGISGHYAGILDGYIIVAGGANFPNGHPFFTSGKKQYYSDVYLFHMESGELKLVGTDKLPYPAGYGLTVKVGNSLYLIGGKNENGELNTIVELNLKNTKLSTRVISNMPFTWSLGGGAWYNDSLYLFSGSRNGKITNQVCKYSLLKHRCIDDESIEAFPGLARIQYPFINHSNKFYIFGGLNTAAKTHVLSDSYSYSFESKTWKQLDSVMVNNELFSVTGGAATVLFHNKVLLLGGVDKVVFENAVVQMNKLEGKELTDFKSSYFNQSAKEHNFSRRQLVYDVKENSWQTLQKDVPFQGGAGPLTVIQDDKKIYWISGEIMPVVRDPSVYEGKIKNQ